LASPPIQRRLKVSSEPSVPLSHLHTLPLNGCLQGLWPWYTLPEFTGFSLKSGWKPQSTHNSCILHTCKTSIMWTTPKSATSETVARTIWTIVTAESVSG
jgi:hypothetical protein